MDSSWLQYADPLDLARDLTVEAAQAVSTSRISKSSSKTIPFIKLKALLDSRSDRDILEGLRKVVSVSPVHASFIYFFLLMPRKQMMYQSKPCLPYFSSVVKNVASPNIEIKKLVYIYLLHYAESDPDLALLSVNAIQKSLTDQNPQVRAMALRTMSGMCVPVISQIVSLAIKRGCGDMSPHVRKAAALAIPKCYRLDPGTLPQLLDYLSILLGDRQYFVAGPAVAAFLEICPERIDIIHKHYRSLVKKLVDMNEWSQLATIQLLMYYSRRCFPRKTQRQKAVERKGFYEDEKETEIETGEEVQILDPDLELFLRACKPLLQSRNSAVVIAVVGCYLYLGTPDYLNDAIGPLVALLRSPSDIQQIALCNIVAVALVSPALFASYASHFLIRSSDTQHIWELKIEMLTLIFPHCGLHLKSVILSELEHFSYNPSLPLVRVSVQAIGRCAQSDPRTFSRAFKVLLSQVNSSDDTVVSEALTVIRHLIQQDPTSHRTTVISLAKNLDVTTSPEARATIIWLVGEFAGTDPENSIAPDVLRILAKGFVDEPEAAKQQIVLLAAKVYLHHLQNYPPEDSVPPATFSDGSDDLNRDAGRSIVIDSPEPKKDHPIALLWQYILLLTRYDTSYDLRDRARVFKALLSNPQSTQLASLVLLAPKPVPHAPSPSESRKGLTLGSSTLVIGGKEVGGNGLPGYRELPDWVVEGEEPDPKLRDEVGEKVEYVAEALKARNVPASRRLDEAVKEQGLTSRVEGVGADRSKQKQKGGTEDKSKSLDDWLDESEESGETEQSDEEEGSTEEESSSEEEESGSEEESDTEEAKMAV
jgi:AP-3 complex subunit beta